MNTSKDRAELVERVAQDWLEANREGRPVKYPDLEHQVAAGCSFGEAILTSTGKRLFDSTPEELRLEGQLWLAVWDRLHTLNSLARPEGQPKLVTLQIPTAPD